MSERDRPTGLLAELGADSKHNSRSRQNLQSGIFAHEGSNRSRHLGWTGVEFTIPYVLGAIPVGIVVIWGAKIAYEGGFLQGLSVIRRIRHHEAQLSEDSNLLRLQETGFADPFEAEIAPESSGNL